MPATIVRGDSSPRSAVSFISLFDFGTGSAATMVATFNSAWKNWSTEILLASGAAVSMVFWVSWSLFWALASPR